MSSGCRQSARLPSSHGAHILQSETPLNQPNNQTQLAQVVARTAETHNASPRLRFNKLDLDELSEELDRQTKETQRLQDEVENATKLTLERFGCAYGIQSPPGQSCHNDCYHASDDPPADFAIVSTDQQVTQPVTYDEDGLNQVVAQMDIGCPGEEFVMKDCLQHPFGLQHTKADTPCNQEILSLDKAIMNLQTELHKVQTQKDILSDLRLKDSKEHVGQMEKMLGMLEDLQNTERARNQKLCEMENEALVVNRRVERLEHNVKEKFISPLSQEKHCGVTWSLEHLGSEECSGVNVQKERMEGLIANLGQEMAMLTDTLCSSKNCSIGLSGKLEQLKKLAERQSSLHQSQVSELTSAVSRHENKICCLEQQLIHAQSQLVDARREREEFLQQRKELQDQLEQHKYFASMEEAPKQYQTLHTDREKLRLQLDDREKRIDILKLQVECSTQVTMQQSQTISKLHQENSLISNQLNQHKLDIQQLTIELVRHKSDLAAAEQERHRIQASVAEHSQRVQEEGLEKQQLTAQLELQRMELLTLKKEHRELQQLHSSCKKEEQEGVVLKLQSWLRNTTYELDQVRSSLRLLEGADEHGHQAAMNMQEKITSQREQIDFLQSRIKHLEETMEKLHQEKHYQNLEHQRQHQELTVIKEEKRKLSNELQALHCKDKKIRDWITKLEGILHKVSERFAECQDFIQLQEHEFFRLKLLHTLDLTDLRGQHLPATLNMPTPHLDPVSALTAPPPFQHVSNIQIMPKRQQDSPTRELRSLVKDLQAVISENHRPHIDNDSTASRFHRRRSAPERMNKTTFSTDEVKTGSRFRRKTCGSESRFPKTAEPNGNLIANKCFKENPSSPGTAARYPSSLQLLSEGRRSPVYALLTSDPNS